MSSSGELSDASSDGAGLSTRECFTLEETDAGEEAEGSETVAVAQPPRRLGRPSEQELALTGSAALDELDRVLASNRIGKETAARLRRQYLLLRETLENSRVLENSLLIQAKDLGQRTLQQQHILERAGGFPDGATNEAGRLRQVLLQHQNELDQSQERTDRLEREIRMLEEEQGEVAREYSRLPKREELEQNLRDLNRQVDELKDEVTLRSLDVQRYRVELDHKNAHVSTIAQEAEELRQNDDILQDQLGELRSGPNIPREIDAIHKRKQELREKAAEQDAFMEELVPQLQELETRMASLLSEKADKLAEFSLLQDTTAAAQRSLDRCNKDMSMAKEREATLLEDRATLELHVRHKTAEYRSLFEANSSRGKEKDRELKQLKKAELQLSVLQQSLARCQEQMEDVQGKAAQQRSQLSALQQQRADVQTETDQLRRALTQQSGIGEAQQASLEERLSLEQRQRTQLKAEQDTLHNLSRDNIALTKARDRDARDYYKARREQRLITGDLKTKDGQREEMRKRLRELETQLKDFADAYEVVKTERNKTHAQILLMTQLTSELHEKSKILQNEIDILMTSSSSKEKILQKCSMVQSTKVMERDSQRQELSKVRLAQAEVQAELEAQREILHRLTRQVDALEQHLDQLRQRYEHTVQERNDLGLQLIERNEEVSVFYEKTNVQDSVLRSANMDLLSREEELRFIRIELSRLKNDILVGRKTLPEKQALEAELATAQVELKQSEERMRALEKAVECASDPARLRMLPGDDPSCSELADKLERIEIQFGERERQLLEKELLFEQVCKMTERVQKRVDSQKKTTLEVATHVNHFQSRIKSTTRRMMALVSELSMQQATALHLQQEVRAGEVQLEQAYKRLETGEAPDDSAAAHWQRMLDKESQKQQRGAAEEKQAQAEEAQVLAGGVVTTAEPRPNAYMPTGEGDLPIPKPYGSHAPFKPSQHGANMRHIRKPELKPIDI